LPDGVHPDDGRSSPQRLLENIIRELAAIHFSALLGAEALVEGSRGLLETACNVQGFFECRTFHLFHQLLLPIDAFNHDCLKVVDTHKAHD